MPRTLPDRQPYPCVSAAAAAALAGDTGRRLHELPWLYLDSVGHEYGPVPGWTMREWLTLGRFPVGSELRVRLPEWERHLPLHQLFPNLNTAFVLPPAWPDAYPDNASGTAATGAQQRSAPATAALARDDAAWVSNAEPLCGSAAGRVGGTPGAQVGGLPSSSSRSSSTLKTKASMKAVVSVPQERPKSPQPPQAQFVLEKLMQEDQLLPPPPPQPSQRQLRELLSQPQEGPPLWEDERQMLLPETGVPWP
mmetsp:Transcript_7424/g.17582  ORF Transcript_7424/g.17582 Transcript_7424/m.17582 type:complete len:251 (-) Transcript_7424:154-906(-)